MPPRRFPPASSLLWPALILLLYTAAAFVAAAGMLPTADEPKYLALGRYLTSHWAWDRASTIVHAPLSFFTHGLLLKPWAFIDARTHLLAARAVMLVYAWGLGWAVYVWARALHGPRAGLLALTLWAALPESLAHGPLLGTDVILACWVTWCGYATWRWVATGRWRYALLGGVALGAALLSKYTAALWGPAILGIGIACAALPGPDGIRRPGRTFAGIAAILGVAYVVLALGYGGRGMFDRWDAHDWASARLATVATTPGLGAVPLLAPLPWWRGIDYVSSAGELGHPGFLLGRRFTFAPWYYQPICFLFKMPVPFLALLAVAPLVTRRLPRVDWRATLCLLAPPLLLVGSLIFANRVAAGFRYVYPLLPALCIVLGRYAAPDLKLLPQARNAMRTCVALCVATALWQFPNYLAYVNLFAGGQDRAYRIFADSTLDWGQTPLPRAVLAAHPAAVVNPGPVPVAGRIFVNANTYHDVFSSGRPHGWLHPLPVRAVHDGVWLELDGADAVELAAPLLAAVARGERAAVERLLYEDADLPLDHRITAYRWLALEYVRAEERDAAEVALALARSLELAQAHALDPAVAYGQCVDLAAAAPDDPVARNNAGVAAYLEGGLAEAVEHLEAAIRLQPRLPAAYSNLAIVRARQGRWADALNRQRTFQAVGASIEARPHTGYRVYYGDQRIMFGAALELWPRYTLDQVEAEVAWRARPSPGTGVARIAAYRVDHRFVEAGLALLEVEALAPGDLAVVQARRDWAEAVAALRRAGRVSA